MKPCKIHFKCRNSKSFPKPEVTCWVYVALEWTREMSAEPPAWRAIDMSHYVIPVHPNSNFPTVFISLRFSFSTLPVLIRWWWFTTNYCICYIDNIYAVSVNIIEVLGSCF